MKPNGQGPERHDRIMLWLLVGALVAPVYIGLLAAFVMFGLWVVGA